MRRTSGLILVLLSFAILPVVGFAYSSNICASSICKELEVGVFMKGITQPCGNLGNCSIADIMLVFANVGNWIIGIVGALVLLFYVWGGFYYFILARGDTGKVTKGKEMLKISTVGLVIVLTAYLAIQTLIGIIAPGYENKLGECVGAESEGKACGASGVCVQGACVNAETLQTPGGDLSGEEFTLPEVSQDACQAAHEGWNCVSVPNDEDQANLVEFGSCDANAFLCGENALCCAPD